MKLFNFMTAARNSGDTNRLRIHTRRFPAIAEPGDPSEPALDALYELAFREKIFAALVELQWFITEQVEEERTARTILAKLELVKDDPAALLDLDREFAQRSQIKQTVET